MSKFNYLVLFIVVLGSFSACQDKASKDQPDLLTQSWEQISESATGSTVNFMMWQGSPEINNYINNYVVPSVKEKYNIDLQITGGQGAEIVQLIMSEKQADVSTGQVDIVWINGETFFQLNQIQGLWGPFVKKLPHAEYIDFSDPYIETDFQQPVNGMEAPWSISQFAMVYDSAKIANPPKNLDELEAYVKNHPGTFTISNDFSGMTLLKCFLAELSGSPEGLNGPFSEEKYEELSTELWDYINRIKPYFWKEGTTFPKEATKMDQMFASGELWLGYGYGEGGIEDKVLQGLFPTSTRVYAWENGTIRNANYLGIPYNSGNKAGALQVINFLLSPEAQLKKLDPEGMNANTILSIEKLPQEWKEQFENVPERKYGMEMAEMDGKDIPEPAPEYMIRLYEEFRTEVIEK